MTIPMSIVQLEYHLKQTAIDPMSYSIGEFADDCACIVQTEDGIWETFMGERGKRYDLRQWHNEGDACVFFIGTLWGEILDLI